MRKSLRTYRRLQAFSLAEALAALMIGSMVLVAVLAIYGRAEHSAAAVVNKLDSSRLVHEVLQRIAEDIDGIIATGSSTNITVENKIDSKGYQTARLEIRKIIHDTRDREKIFEKIVWQASYDYDNDTGALILYRGRSGIGPEDKLLDEQKQRWQRELFVPVCSGVTFFKIQAGEADNFQDIWTGSSLPAGIVVTISFAKPFETVSGELDVPDSQKITRTIAVNRTRKIRFRIVEKEDKEKTEDEQKSD